MGMGGGDGAKPVTAKQFAALLCGEAERLSGLAQEAAAVGDCDGAGRLAGEARDAVDSLKVHSIKYRTNR